MGAVFCGLFNFALARAFRRRAAPRAPGRRMVNQGFSRLGEAGVSPEGWVMNTTSSASPLAAGRAALLAGDPRAAAALLEQATSAAPADLEARYWLASAKLTLGDPGAAAAMNDARTLHALVQARAMGADIGRCQSEPAYAAEVADALYAQSLVAMSAAIQALPLSAGVVDASGLLSYALALQHQGRAEEACEAFRLAAEAFPSPPVAQFMIYPQLLCDDGEARHHRAASAWARAYAAGPAAGPASNPSRAGRRLRIGYVAPRFAGCQLAQFMAPLLENHDPAAAAVTLYPASAATDADWPGWIDVHPIGERDDANAAALVRADAIDVLVDCWGHSAGSRIALFARRPAPVQAAWMNFIHTTGLEAIDYVLHAGPEDADPADGALFTEKLWPIGPVFNAFRPAPGRLAPAPTPALASGQVTFGSFNHPAKLSGHTLDAWAAVLRGAPEARLLLRYRYFADPVLQRTTQARFAARGVAPERIVFAGHASGEAYLQAFQAIDLMLDAWPAPGSTTTLDALSNGVPVLIKDAATTGARYARSILEACGLGDLVASSPEDFVARAVALARDIEGLDAIRSQVRPAFDGGPLCDEAGFTRRVEAAFGRMFDRWWEGRALCGARGAA